MFADRIAAIRAHQNSALNQELFHRLAVQLMCQDQLVRSLERWSEQYSILETGFCPCGYGLILVGLEKSPWDRWCYCLHDRAWLACPTCRDRYRVAVRAAPVSSDVRAGDLDVDCLNSQVKYRMIVRPYYLWKMESVLKV